WRLHHKNEHGPRRLPGPAAHSGLPLEGSQSMREHRARLHELQEHLAFAELERSACRILATTPEPAERPEVVESARHFERLHLEIERVVGRCDMRKLR